MKNSRTNQESVSAVEKVKGRRRKGRQGVTHLHCGKLSPEIFYPKTEQLCCRR